MSHSSDAPALPHDRKIAGALQFIGHGGAGLKLSSASSSLDAAGNVRLSTSLVGQLLHGDKQVLAGDDAAVQQELTRRINPDIIFSCELAGDASSTVSDLIEVSHLGQPFVKAGDDFMGLPVVVLQQLERGPSGGHKASIVRTSKSVASVPVHIRTHATIAVSGSVSLRDALTQIRQLLQEQIAQLTSLLAHTASSMESDADLCAAWSSTAAPCLTAQYAQFFPFADGKAAADLTGTYATTHWPDCPIALPFILVATRTAGDSGSPVRVVPVEDNAFAQAQRRAMHHELGLALDRPLFRVACAVLHQQPGWAKQTARGGGDEEEGGGIKGPVLRNVHRGMPGSSVEGGRVHTVQGDYEYYHYMQHGFNDRGWGCAYRSLQTVLSWFRLNQYTTAETPSHEQVQRVLVGIQDKPPSFVGSKQWIGSQEVGYVLDELAGVTSKFIFVSSGAELGTVARQLREHFETQGTPVMMGGGQLAYTILGIDYNEDTGEVEFIILDPHYTGADDLAKIQTKSVTMEGYKAVPVSWKPVWSFSERSFYNLCLPQRPQAY